MIFINKRKFKLYGVSLEERRAIGGRKEGVYVFLILSKNPRRRHIKYVGRTLDLMIRLSGHTVRKMLSQGLKQGEEVKVAFIEIKTWQDRRDFELELVRKYNPEYNIQLTRPYRGPKKEYKRKYQSHSKLPNHV